MIGVEVIYVMQWSRDIVHQTVGGMESSVAKRNNLSILHQLLEL